MTRVPVDPDEPMSSQDVDTEAPPPRARNRGNGKGEADVEIEREVTKRHMIEAITSVVVVVLYMAFTLLRDRDSGVVVLDDDGKGPADDWKD